MKTEKHLEKNGDSIQESPTKTQRGKPEKTSKEIVKFYEVKARNPITGKIMDVRVECGPERTPEQQEAAVKKQLAELKLEPIEQLEITDPFTGKTSLITIDRSGTTQQKLAIALLDKNIPQDRKDYIMSMYLYERGKESMSMITDIMRYKGQYTREGRVFQSQMRLDFESFVNSFTHYLQNQSRMLGISLGVNIEQEKEKFIEWLAKKENKGTGVYYKDFYESTRAIPKEDVAKVALIEMAIFANDEASDLTKKVENIVRAREAMRGGGIYISKSGQPFSVNDPEIMEIVKKEREAEQEIDKENVK
jgi:hypothetical protein